MACTESAACGGAASCAMGADKCGSGADKCGSFADKCRSRQATITWRDSTMADSPAKASIKALSQMTLIRRGIPRAAWPTQATASAENGASFPPALVQRYWMYGPTSSANKG